ncbi:MAG: Fis family transcriptional regulator [Holosporaceae bacterium]|jgi:two-component system nitrogen regulation response regulator GlnG|nr:Fis family transcriptional regulator [Holosporaceae bacterium]
MSAKEILENVEQGFSKEIEKHLERYFTFHNGDVIPPGLYDRILKEVERVVFEVTLRHVNGNQLKAAKILGISRNTLRKKTIQD